MRWESKGLHAARECKASGGCRATARAGAVVPAGRVAARVVARERDARASGREAEVAVGARWSAHALPPRGRDGTRGSGPGSIIQHIGDRASALDELGLEDGDLLTLLGERLLRLAEVGVELLADEFAVLHAVAEV